MPAIFPGVSAGLNPMLGLLPQNRPGRDEPEAGGMSIFSSMDQPGGSAAAAGFMARYLDALTLVERLHRLLLDVIKDEFERVGVIEINPVQALLLFNVGDNEVTAGELKSRGYYQGSNVSYNLKKLVELGYMHHQRCEIDRRSVRVRLTPRGREVRDIVARLFQTHAKGLQERGVLDMGGIEDIAHALKRLERYWSDQIRYIY
jgi:DNA-binding MarR family transcriptional regulator